MKRFLALLTLSAFAMFGQSSETATFIAALSPANEVPAITGYDATGTALIYAHVVRNAQGQIISGSVDFVGMYNFPGAATVTGFHIHNGPAGVNAGVVINTGLGAGANSLAINGRGAIERQAQVLPTDVAGVAALRGMFENPLGYYANIHTTDYAGGIIRGQLYRAERAVYIGRMSPAKEVPAITGYAASGTGSVEAVRAYDARGRYIAGVATFNVDYVMPEQATITGLHIHDGSAAVAGPVVINTGISAAASVDTPGNGIGNIVRRVEVPETPAGARNALDGLFDNTPGFYINLHTTKYPGGIIRSQMARTEAIRIPVTMSPAQEVPAITGLDASALAAVEINALRDPAGTIVAAVLTFDVNPRFPGDTTFTGLHIHDEKAGNNGAVTMNSGLRSLPMNGGFGNIWLPTNIGGGQALTSLNSLVVNPENHYLNIHTTVNAGGAVRAQMGVANNRPPVVTEVISAVSDLNARTVAPGGQFTIFGNDLIKLAGNDDGVEVARLPMSLNGTSVTIGGIAAPIIVAGIEPRNNPSNYIVAQVPYETPVGAQMVVVKSANGTSTARATTVAAQAPALFFDGQGAIVFRADNFEQIRPETAARAGDTLAILSTGLGQSVPPSATGVVSDNSAAIAQPTTLTVGGQAAIVAGSASVPGFPGFYITLFAMPRGVNPGMSPVILRVNNQTSNTVMMPVR